MLLLTLPESTQIGGETLRNSIRYFIYMHELIDVNQYTPKVVISLL